MVKTRIVESEPVMIMMEGKRKYLLLADLHIGFESAFQAKDIDKNPSILIAKTCSTPAKP